MSDLVSNPPAQAEVQSVALEHLASIRQKLADLQRLERTLAEVAARCAGGQVPDCPILEALFGEAT